LIVPILLVMFNIFLLIFPQTVLTASREGLLLWFNHVLPTLLPFMIATNMLIALGFAEFIAELLSPVMKKIFGLPGAAGFGLVMGLTTGYPMGAKTVADLRRRGRLTADEAQHLLQFCNNAGPLFILGVVGAGMFQNVRVGYLLWAAHVCSALLIGVLFRKTRNKGRLPETVSLGAILKKYRENRLSNVHSVGEVLGNAVTNAMESMVFIGGIIIFFRVVLAVFETIGLPPGTISHGILSGAIEVTSGASRISAIPVSKISLAAAAFVIGFGGLAVHAQAFHFTAGLGIKNGKYLWAKFLHGIFAAVITVLLFAVT